MNFEYLSNCISQANREIAAGRYELGIRWCKQALDVHPQISEAWFNLGLAYKGLGKTNTAIESFKKAGHYAPNSSDAQNAIGLSLLELGCEKDAEACFFKSITLNASDPAPLSNLGLLRKDQHRLKDAASLFIKAIQLAPDVAILYSNLAGVLNRLDLFLDATHAAEKAISISPELADAWNNLSISLARLDKNAQSINAAKKALELKPSINWLGGGITYSKLKICDWHQFPEALLVASNSIQDNKAYIEPIALLSITDDAYLQQMCASTYVRTLYKSSSKPLPLYNNDKIRIGYVSSDFGAHAVSYLATGLIECHDRSKFEIHGFDTGAHATGKYRERLSKAFDQFHMLSDHSTSDMIDCILKNKVDILIDLNGHTKGATTELFAAKPASLQINLIGYPGTMGADFMDYIIGDKTLIPINEAGFYSEKVIYLPDCFQPNDSKREIGTISSRNHYSLNEKDFVFACFNQPAKITPEIFAAWMSILNAVPNSVLWLAIQEEDAKLNLVVNAKANGISANRIIFADRSAYAEHLAKHKLVDLMLDTFPFNGGTTTSDALWSGAPLLSIAGHSFASRMGASILNSIGLEDLITSSISDYMEKAIELALDQEKLAAIRAKLIENTKTAPLFNTERYTRNFEKGLEIALTRRHQGLRTEHIYVVD